MEETNLLIDPFMSIMFIVGGLFLLYVVYRARVNLAIRGVFNNDSYQLGMVFGTVCMMLSMGFLGVFLWVMS